MNCRRFVLLLVLAGIATPAMSADRACQDALPESPRWFDRAQSYFSVRACGPAIWFDRFFGDQREDEVASALIRIIPQAQYTDLDYDEYHVRFKASVSLPNLSDRLSLIFDDDAASESQLLPGETDHNLLETEPRRTTAALRYLVKLKDASRADFDVGLRSHAKIFARARYVKHWLPESWLQLRYTQTFMFRDGPGWSEFSLLDVEHPMTRGRLLRFSSQLSLAEEYDGLRVREGLQLMRQIDKDRALSYNAFALLEEQPEWRDASYSLSVRYRQRVFRPWIFVEAEPFLDFQREHGFRTNPGIILRAEFWFGDTDRGGRGARKTDGDLPTEVMPEEAMPEEETPEEETPEEETPAGTAIPEDMSPAEAVTSPNDVPVADPAASQ